MYLTTMRYFYHGLDSQTVRRDRDTVVIALGNARFNIVGHGLVAIEILFPRMFRDNKQRRFHVI